MRYITATALRSMWDGIKMEGLLGGSCRLFKVHIDGLQDQKPTLFLVRRYMNCARITSEATGPISVVLEISPQSRSAFCQVEMSDMFRV